MGGLRIVGLGHVGPRLRGHVLGASGFVERGTPLRRTEVPLAGTVLVLSLGPPILVDGGWTGSFVAGQYLRPVVTGHGGEQAGLQINLSSLGGRALLGVPMNELANRTVALEDVLPGAAELTERVAEAPTWAARCAILDETLGARLAAAPSPPPEVARAYARIMRSGGAVRVEALAAETGWSRRHLAARFQEEVGLPPKAFARIIRFERAVARLRAGAPLADVAFEAGYADQPHFNREFRSFMGTTPGAFPFVQDTPAAA
jgi:AraC-like DNA-binding protein